MHWLLAGLAGIGFVELLFRLPVAATLHRFRETASRVFAVVSSRRISDHWKEKALPRFAWRIFTLTLRLGVLIAAAFIPFVLLAVVSDAVGVPLVEFTLSWVGILYVSALSAIYAKVRFPRAVRTGAYGPWDQFIHRLALGNEAVAELSFSIERTCFRVPADAATDRKHVFVAGLARAGTTVLMRRLYGTGAFRSLTYRDMPFVLAPNLWERITRTSRKDMAAEERAHGDGIRVDFDSPEALEEVFWRVHCGDAYLRWDRLVPMTTTQEEEARFRQYVALLLRKDPSKRYLSKNNNNILRLPSLSRCFPNAVVIVPFRDPFQQALSLMRQHQAFSERHRDDVFSRQYMTWLGHHEFGLGHRPFVFDASQMPIRKARDPLSDPGYWVRLWIDSYTYLDETAPASCAFLSYERLCEDVDTVWPRMCADLDLPLQSAHEPLRLARTAATCEVPDALMGEANTLYARLCDREAWR
jgi:hypothetical protein